MKVVLLLCFLFSLCFCEDLIVCPRIGCIQGTVLPGHQRPYEAFLGVPFAKPPVGLLRFRNPQPIGYWGTRVWNGTYSRDTCIQKIFASHQLFSYGEEDCLYMNIYRPIRKKTTKKLPVIVLITGGGYAIGTASHDDFAPDYLMNSKDIIMIVLQHRLGVFGYLCSSTSACPGNFGLKDQQMALEWIRDNIETFGGNSLRVTLLGQGSGCAAVQMHMMNDKSSLLFHQVILQSGSLAHWALLRNPRTQFKRQVQYVGIKYKKKSSKEMVAKLRKVDAVTLRESVDRFKFWYNDHLVNYRPCIEKETWEDAFLTANPYDAWANGTYKPKPVLITFTPNDGTYRAPILTNDTLIDDFNARMRELLPKFLEFPSKYVDEVLSFYFGEENPHIGQDNQDVFIKMVSDRYFHQSLYNTVNQLRSNTYYNKMYPLYLYKFNFNSEFRYTKRITGTDENFGVGYRDDLLFMFRIASVFPAIQPDSVEARMSDLYVGMLAHFATTGKEKSWLSHSKCTEKVNGFCEYQEFQKFSQFPTEEVIVRASDEFRVDAAEFWNEIDERK